MVWWLDVFVSIGVFSLITYFILKSFFNSSARGTLVRKWENISLILVGFFLFVLLGSHNLLRYFQGQENEGLLAGLAALLLGITVILSRVIVLFQLNISSKWINYLWLLVGILFVMWGGYDLQTHYLDTGNILLLQPLFVVVIGIYAVIVSMQKTRGDSSEKTELFPSE